jgi:hypothetical protein
MTQMALQSTTHARLVVILLTIMQVLKLKLKQSLFMVGFT